MFIDDALPYLEKERALPNGGPERESKRCAVADAGAKPDLAHHVDLAQLGRDDPPVRIFKGMGLDDIATSVYCGYRHSLQDCRQSGRSDPCSEKRPRSDPFKNVHLHYLRGLDKTLSSILHSVHHSRPIVSSYTPCDLGKQERSTPARVVMAPVLKPIEYFNSTEEFLSVMREYFQTVVTLEDYGLAHRNITLENLSIKTSSTQKGNGIGIISSFDSRSNGSEKGKCSPDFVYTMPIRRVNEDPNVRDDLRYDGLRSLFLCFISIATTRDGPRNKKRPTLSFRNSAVYQWNTKPDPDGLSQFKRIVRDKSSIMSSKSRFRKKVMKYVASPFLRLEPCFMALRSMLYDAHWAEYRDQLTRLYHDRDEDEYERDKAVSTFKEVMDEAWTCTKEAQVMAETMPPRSDQNKSFPCYSEPGTRTRNDTEEFSSLSLAEGEHASTFRFIDGRKTTSYAVNSKRMTACEAGCVIRCEADCLQVSYCRHGKRVVRADRREAALRAVVLICHLHAAGLANYYSWVRSSLIKGGKFQNKDLSNEVHSRMVRCPFSRSDTVAGEEEVKISYDEHNVFLGPWE